MENYRVIMQGGGVWWFSDATKGVSRHDYSTKVILIVLWVGNFFSTEYKVILLSTSFCWLYKRSTPLLSPYNWNKSELWFVNPNQKTVINAAFIRFWLHESVKRSQSDSKKWFSLILYTTCCKRYEMMTVKGIQQQIDGKCEKDL